MQSPLSPPDPRHPLVPALVTLLLLGAYAAGGAMLVAADPGPGDEVSIDGTVTAPDGTAASDAVVLFSSDETLDRFTPDELRAFAEDPPENVTVTTVDGDGRFDATVTWERSEAALAVSDAGISEIVFTGRENTTIDLRLRENRPQTVHAHIGSISHDEQETDLFINLQHNGETAVEDLSVTVDSLPEGWSIERVETDGQYDADSRTLTWASIQPGNEVDTTLVVRAPEDADPGEYTVELRAESTTHDISVADPVETVEILPENTPGPTTTPPPSDAGTPASPDATDEATPPPDPSETPTLEESEAPSTEAPSTADGETQAGQATDAAGTETSTTGPGFGVLAVLASLTALTVLAARKR